jgi:hypothetical protein
MIHHKPPAPEYQVEPDKVLPALLGGRAKLTVLSHSGKHYTYKISRPKNGDKIWFVSVRTAATGDDRSDYTYLGYLKPDHAGVVRLRIGKSTRPDHLAWRGFQWLWGQVDSKGLVPPQKAVVLTSGRCCRCSRELTDPESIRAGLGPVCRLAA